MRCIDTAVETILTAISELGYLSNTLIVFAGDNGGAPKNGGYNYPLRGSKGTIYEGGLRQASFAFGAGISSSVIGTTYYGVLHLTDMFPTFLSVATAGHWQEHFDYTLDGIDNWQAISKGSESNRRITCLNVGDKTGPGLRYGDYTLLYGVGNDGWYAQPDMLTGEQKYESNRTRLEDDCNEVRWNEEGGYYEGDDCYFLFDIANDPKQENNLYYTGSYNDMITTMVTLLEPYQEAAVSKNFSPPKH